MPLNLRGGTLQSCSWHVSLQPVSHTLATPWMDWKCLMVYCFINLIASPCSILIFIICFAFLFFFLHFHFDSPYVISFSHSNYFKSQFMQILSIFHLQKDSIICWMFWTAAPLVMIVHLGILTPTPTQRGMNSLVAETPCLHKTLCLSIISFVLWSLSIITALNFFILKQILVSMLHF